MKGSKYYLLIPVVLLVSCGEDPEGPAPPELSIEYTSLDVDVYRGIRSDVEFRVRNTGEDDLVITNARTDVNWMAVDPESTSVAGGMIGIFTLTINTDIIPVHQDQLFGRFRFDTNDPDYPHVQISVDVTVNEPYWDPMSVTPTSILLTMSTESDTTVYLTVTNPAPETHSVESVEPEFSWITVDPDTMTLMPGASGSLTLSVSSAGLAVGSYESDVWIETDDDQATYISITVTLNVAADLGPTRVVIAEEFTGTWCQFCPTSMEALHDLQEYAPSNVAALVYHLDDDFEVNGNEMRRQYYGISAYPHVQFDGVIPVVGATADFTEYFAERFEIPIPLSLRIILTQYESATGLGTAEVHMNSLVDSTLNFNYRMCLTGLDSTYTWQGYDHLYNTVLLHVTETAGTSIQLDPLSTETRSYGFTVPDDWRGRACELVGFAQYDPAKEILQGAKTSVQ